MSVCSFVKLFRETVRESSLKKNGARNYSRCCCVKMFEDENRRKIKTVCDYALVHLHMHVCDACAIIVPCAVQSAYYIKMFLMQLTCTSRACGSLIPSCVCGCLIFPIFPDLAFLPLRLQFSSARFGQPDLKSVFMCSSVQLGFRRPMLRVISFHINLVYLFIRVACAYIGVCEASVVLFICIIRLFLSLVVTLYP